MLNFVLMPSAFCRGVVCAKHAGVTSAESLLYKFENTRNMNLNSKKKSTRVCVGLFFLLGGIEYGESFS